MPDDAPTPKGTDVVLLHSPTEDGEGVRVIRAREDRIEAGEVRPLKDGQPLSGGEIVKLAPRQNAPHLCDVEVLTKVALPGASARVGDRSGPAQVASLAYRESWDRIFGDEAPVSDAGDPAPKPKTLN